MQLTDKVLKELGITKIERRISIDEIDFTTTLDFEDNRVLYTKKKDIIIDNAFEPYIYQLKTKNQIEIKNIYLIEPKELNVFMEELEKIKNSNLNIEMDFDKKDVFSDGESDNRKLDETQISKLIQSILFEAVQNGVSDIHILPKENNLLIKFRQDGEMIIFKELSKNYRNFIINKLKTLGKMDITNSMVPQDGKIKTEIKNKKLELRVSTCPTIYGEDCVLRVQQSDNLFNFKLDDMGFEPEQLATYRHNFTKPTGLILNVGATGSGKSTTFYLTIAELSEKYSTKNIVTVEDPVEIRYPLITQIEVDEKRGRPYSSILKSLLRQDPDIILIGEIRDETTASIAVKASLTGHLVLRTLHANDAFNSIGRLRDLGISDPLIGATSNCFISQRLLKKLCPVCKIEEKVLYEDVVKYSLEEGKPIYSPKIYPSDDKLEEYKIKNGVDYPEEKCPNCKGKGYKGRTAIIEVLEIDEDMKTAISAGMSEIEIKKLAKKKEFQNLWKLGVKKLHNGEIRLTDLTLNVSKDVILNSKEEMVFVDNRFVFYPDKLIEIKVKNKTGFVFDISKRGMSLIFNESYLMDINKEVNIQIGSEVIPFIRKSYGKVGNKFMVGGIYKGDLSHIIDNL